MLYFCRFVKPDREICPAEFITLPFLVRFVEKRRKPYLLMTEKLSYMKAQRHLTLEELAQRTGIPLGTINKIFSGQTKHPSAAALNEIGKVLRVPQRYFLDDSVPMECSIGTYTESQGIFPISEREWELLTQYRRLAEREQQTLDALLELLVELAPRAVLRGPVRCLMCYQTIAQGQLGAYGDGFYFRPLLAFTDPLVDQADFAVRLSDRSMYPVNSSGTVFAVKKVETLQNQIGVFLVNREWFIRKFQRRRGVSKLVSINLDLKDLVLTDRDEVRCLGTVLGVIRDYRWTDAFGR